MKLYLNHPFHYEAENLTRLFFPSEKIQVIREPFIEGESKAPSENSDGSEGFIVSSLQKADGSYKITAYVKVGERESYDESFVSDTLAEKGFFTEEKQGEERDKAELLMAQCLYKALSELASYTPPWGILTGVRPSKLYRSLYEEKGYGAFDFFKNELFVSENKINSFTVL